MCLPIYIFVSDENDSIRDDVVFSDNRRHKTRIHKVRSQAGSELFWEAPHHTAHSKPYVSPRSDIRIASAGIAGPAARVPGKQVGM